MSSAGIRRPLAFHIGTTFACIAPVDLSRAIHAEPLPLRYPGLKMILVRVRHRWYENVMVGKQPISALYYRPGSSGTS